MNCLNRTKRRLAHHFPEKKFTEKELAEIIVLSLKKAEAIIKRNELDAIPNPTAKQVRMASAQQGICTKLINRIADIVSRAATLNKEDKL